MAMNLNEVYSVAVVFQKTRGDGNRIDTALRHTYVEARSPEEAFGKGYEICRNDFGISGEDNGGWFLLLRSVIKLLKPKEEQ